MYYYNVHSILKVCSEVKLIELEYFRCQEILYEDTDLAIIAVKSLNRKFNFRRKMIVDDESRHLNIIRYTEHFGPYGAQYNITFSDDKIKVHVNRLVSNSPHVLYVNLVEPLLRFLFISKGYVLLHSACINNDSDEKGILISAPPDTGKTTTVLKCVKNGFSFLSDDMTILSLPNEAISFPKPLTVSSHTFKTAATISKAKNNENCVRSISLRLRSMIHSEKGRKLMRKLSKFNVPIFTINALGQLLIKPPKFNIDALIQDVSIKERTKIYDLVFLQYGPGAEQSLSVNNHIATSIAIENSDDAFHFPPYREMLNYLAIGGKSARDLLDMESQLLEEFLSNITCTVMKSVDRGWYRYLQGDTLKKKEDILYLRDV